MTYWKIQSGKESDKNWYFWNNGHVKAKSCRIQELILVYLLFNVKKQKTVEHAVTLEANAIWTIHKGIHILWV